MFAPDKQENEVRAIGEVRERLRSRYAGRSPKEISSVVDQAAAKFSTARIRDFVPILVERISKDELNRRVSASR